MNDRLKEIVKYKTHGKQKVFAELVGWSPQYLARLLHGADFGLKPVLAILKAVPEINARWLLLGEGDMLDYTQRVDSLHRETINHLQTVLDLERFIPVMTPDELIEYEQIVTGHKNTEFSAATRSTWIVRLLEREQDVSRRISDATKQSDEICKQQTANS